ncbi:ROK family protein [Mariniflexile sp.]|uniref:ROK family protein n=1 Tax=Mariniflexile sp. TaxID=1979402 RepID=UPI004048A8AD
MKKSANTEFSTHNREKVGRNFTIGIDLGGTFIKIGLLHDGELIDRKEIPAQSASGLKSQLPILEDEIDQLLKSNQLKANNVLGIGFSFAGLVDSVENRILSTNQKYDDGPKTNLVAWAKKKWNWQLFAMNDARMALLGEWQHGAGKGCSDVVMLTLGTGIGSAVLMGGQLLIGKHFQAGNLGGHFVVNHKGTVCTCGNVGCVESEASTWRLPTLLKDHPKFPESTMKNEEILDFKTLFHHANNNDEVAKEVRNHCISAWSSGIISMIHAFDPEMVIISGGIMKSADIILPAIQEKVHQLAWTPWGKVKVVNAAHPDSAALYGADYLVRTANM